MPTSHYFIAIPLKQHIQYDLGHWQSDLSRELPYKQWTYKEDLHVTLKFLGPVIDTQLDQLKKELQTIKSRSVFQLYISGLAYFGNPKQPRVLFANIVHSAPLLELEKAVEACAEKADFPREKRMFKPHITLAKKWNGESKEKELQSFVEHFSDCDLHMIVDKVVIYKIHPGKQPKYECESTYDLDA